MTVYANLWPFLPNWDSPIRLSYAFETTMCRTRHLVEQRKPLIPAPKRKMVASFLCRTLQQRTSLEHFIIANQAYYVSVPIYPEPMTPTATGDLFGLGTLNLLSTHVNNFNLHTLTTLGAATDNCALFDVDLLTAAIRLSISALPSATSLTISPVISSHSFIGERSLLFPCFDSNATLTKVNDITDRVRQYDVTFEEIN